MVLKDDGLAAAITRANKGRLGLIPDAAADEVLLEQRFNCSEKLAVYGTLAPGKVNHHQIADLGGDWRDAALRGELGQVPEGVHQGLPGLRLDPAGSVMPVRLLVSAKLPSAWSRLDAFEDAEMQRLLVLLEQQGKATDVVNVYALRREMLAALA